MERDDDRGKHVRTLDIKHEHKETGHAGELSNHSSGPPHGHDETVDESVDVTSTPRGYGK